MKILVTDDEGVTLRLTELSLKQWGHQVVTAEGGVAAWEAYQKEAFDAVVTDWMMPEMDGVALTREIRAHASRRYPWVIMLTSKNFRDHYRSAMEAGADDFLTKPLDRELLRVRLVVAGRVLDMKKQIGQMSRLIPICMSCKSVRDTSDQWTRIEQFLTREGTDLSHGFCPECYYKQSLLPEVKEVRKGLPSPADHTLDPVVVEAYQERDRTHPPGVWEELIESFLALARTRIEIDLRGAAEEGLDDPSRARLESHAQRAQDIGATRLAELIARFLRSRAPENAHAALEELSRVERLLQGEERQGPPVEIPVGP